MFSVSELRRAPPGLDRDAAPGWDILSCARADEGGRSRRLVAQHLGLHFLYRFFGNDLEDEAVLLGRIQEEERRRRNGPGALPEGRCDDGENTIDAARREVDEEVGVSFERALPLQWCRATARRTVGVNRR